MLLKRLLVGPALITARADEEQVYRRRSHWLFLPPIRFLPSPTPPRRFCLS